MKKNIFLCLLIALLSGSCNQKEESPIIGSWQLISGNAVTQDTIINFPVSASGKHMKIIGEKYFSTIWQDTTISKSDAWYAGFNGGTYTFENEVYTETELYFFPTSGIGNTWSAKAEFRSDTMVLTYIPKDTYSKNTSVEKWKRLE